MAKSNETIKKELITELDRRVEDIKSEIFEMYQTLKSENINFASNSVNISKRKLDDAINEVNKLKEELNERLKEAENALNTASKILDLDGHGINIQAFIDLFKENEKHKNWMKYNSSELETIRKDYRNISQKIIKENDKEGIFENLAKQVDNVKTEVKENKKERRSLLNQKEMILNTDSGFSLKVVNDNIILEGPNSKIILDKDGIHLEGNVFINNELV